MLGLDREGVDMPPRHFGQRLAQRRTVGSPADSEPAYPRLGGVNATHHSWARAAAAALAVPALSACGVNFGAQTDQVYTPADGENDRAGDVDVLNALVVSETAGTGRLIAGLSNNNTENADVLTGVSGAEESSAVQVTAEGVEIPAGGLVQLASDEVPPVMLSGDPEQLHPGAFVRVTFTFENAEPATLNVPVLEPGDDYADVEIPELPETPEG
jgi:copper(I)-binding protein